jgi:hemerythrin-like domain-containing protein
MSLATVRVLRAEHDAIRAVLAQLEAAVAAAERGVAVPRDLFTDVQEFFTIFVDRCHHGKEEAEVFPRLATQAGALVQRLEADHATGRQLAAAYADAVQAYTPGDPAAGRRLAAAARAYAAHLTDHIDRETAALLPAIEQTLAADDHALAAAFERIEVERIGAGTHERLHAMIETLPHRIARALGQGPARPPP